jgi:hypothetical protein
MTARRAALAMCLPAMLGGCGYRVAGRGDMVPKNIKTIAVPAFGNVTTRYRLAERLPADIAREFISRTRYRVVSEPDQADAVLTGVLIGYRADPVVFDPTTSRASGLQATVQLQVTLTDRVTGAVIFSRPNMDVRERYELSIDPKVYFDESEAAMGRLSRDVARSVVSAVLENF